MQTIQQRTRFFTSSSYACLVAVVITSLSLLFPLAGLVSADIVDTSNNACASPGSSSVSSILGYHHLGIIGVNGAGLDWAKNSCLHAELSHFNEYALYVGTNYPSSGCHTSPNRKNAYNCGYQLGLFDVAYASSQQAGSSTWFLDVEEGSGVTWSTHSLDSSFLWGLEDALQARGVTTIGFYSTSSQWHNITGDWHSGNDAWYATGVNGTPSSSVIHQVCRSGFTGGPVVIYQWIVGGISSGLDYDGACP
jgi:hypothetical protein